MSLTALRNNTKVKGKNFFKKPKINCLTEKIRRVRIGKSLFFEN